MRRSPGGRELAGLQPVPPEHPPEVRGESVDDVAVGEPAVAVLAPGRSPRVPEAERPLLGTDAQAVVVPQGNDRLAAEGRVEVAREWDGRRFGRRVEDGKAEGDRQPR